MCVCVYVISCVHTGLLMSLDLQRRFGCYRHYMSHVFYMYFTRLVTCFNVLTRVFTCFIRGFTLHVFYT